MKLNHKALAPTIIALALFVGMAIGIAPEQFANAQGGVTNFDNLTLSADLIVGDDATIGDDLTVTGDLAVSGSTISGGVTDDLLIDGTLEVSETALITGVLTTVAAANVGTTLTAADLAATDDLTVGDDALVSGNLQVAGTSLLTGVVTSVAGITVGTDLIVGDDANVTAQSAISVTNGGVFTPTGTYQPITAGQAVTPTLSAGGATAGDLLVLINTANFAVILEDSGTTMLTGDLTLGQYDSLTLWFDGTNWIELSTSNN